MTRIRFLCGTKPVAGERRPVTAKQCLRNAAFGLFFVIFLLLSAAFLFKKDVLHQIQFGVFGAVYIFHVYQQFDRYRRIRCGEKFETVYTAPSPKLVKRRIATFKATAIVLNLFWMLNLVFMIYIMHGSHPEAVVTLLVCQVMFLLVGYYLFPCAKALSNVPVVAVLPVTNSDPSITMASTKEISALQPEANASSTVLGAEHWWTENASREEIVNTRR